MVNSSSFRIVEGDADVTGPGVARMLASASCVTRNSAFWAPGGRASLGGSSPGTNSTRAPVLNASASHDCLSAPTRPTFSIGAARNPCSIASISLMA